VPNNGVRQATEQSSLGRAQEYGVRDYRYTIVNDRTVLVDPHRRRIVEVVE
jgi:hypothetical protein